MRRAIAVGLLALVVACDSERPEYAIVDEPILTAASSCGELEATIESLAISEMNADIDAIIDEIASGDGRGDGAAVPGAAPPSPAAPASPEGARDFTTTNTQERDVDEPDFVKNDGSRIFVLQGRLLIGLASWPPESTRIVSQTVIEGRPHALLLDRDRLAVFSAVYVPGLAAPDDGYFWPQPAVASVPPQDPANAVKVTLFDVSSATPSVVDELFLEGAYVDARRSDGTARLVSRAPRRGPRLLYWPEERVDWSSRADAIAAMEKLRRENTRRIRDSRLADWLPRAFAGSPGGLRELARDCPGFAATNAPLRLGFTTITTLDLAGASAEHRTLLARADLAYSSSRFLYLAAPHEWHRHRSETNVREDHTYLFQYELEPGRRGVRQVGAGGVPGSILDQFSLDEEGGYLRVATTRRTWLGWELKSTTNAVSVLRGSGGRLQQVGELTGLARDEQLYSARFEGPRGFLVTFRVVDPLFTLDLADPERPRVAGELKVPGFSTYLHLLDTNHLLAVGREAAGDGRWVGGLQLQVFDVSDFAHPAVRHRHALGSRSSSSEAEYDHKAFTYFPARGLLALPFADWARSRPWTAFASLELLRVTVEEGITPVGSVEHGDLFAGLDAPWPGFTPQIRRSILADDYVYSISQGGLKVHDTRRLSRALATVSFPPAP